MGTTKWEVSWRIIIHEQNQQFTTCEEALERVRELLEAEIWWIELDTIVVGGERHGRQD